MIQTTTMIPPPNVASQLNSVVAAFISMFTGAGWVQTSDTSQLTSSGTVYATTAYTAVGYLMFRMNDDLQSTAPVFAKIEIGCSGSSYTTSLGIWVTVGTATDGAGVLSGIVSTRAAINVGSSASTGTATNYSNGTSSRIVIDLIESWVDATSSYGRMIISIERSHDTTGADTVDGVLILLSSNQSTNSAYSQYLDFSNSIVSTQYSKWNCAPPPSGSGAVGNNVYMYPVRGWKPGETCASLNLFEYFTSDLTAANPVTATTWDGSGHSLYPLGWNNSGTYYGGTGYLAMRAD